MPNLCFSQSQSSFWIDKKYGFDFNRYPPTLISLRGSSYYYWNVGSVSDAQGNLLFFTDGLNYFDKYGEVMPNGLNVTVTDWNGSQGVSPYSIIVAPYPGSASKFFIFQYVVPNCNYPLCIDNMLRYSVVDMALNSGKGDVTEKVVEIGKSIGEYTVIKTQKDGEGFWLISANQENEPSLYAYRVSSNGINKTPVISHVGSFFNQTYIKASPNGEYLVLSGTYQNGTHCLKILKFNGLTGVLEPCREVKSLGTKDYTIYPQTDVYLEFPEFSSDSRFLYIIKDSVYTTSASQVKSYKQLINYDLETLNQSSFDASLQTLFRFPSADGQTKAYQQLTPQGKIVISDFQFKGSFHVINYPEACTIEKKDFLENAINVGTEAYAYNRLPTFPAWYFYKKSNTQEKFAGNDTTICSDTNIKIGTSVIPGYTYQWSQVQGLSENDIATPTFSSSVNNTGINDTTTLYLKVISDNACTYLDTIKISVKPQWKINGSPSVCPGVKQISYWIDIWNGGDLSWTVSGGKISAYPKPDSILVDWFGINLNAEVSAFTNELNTCENMITSMAVKVNTHLDTEKPKGLEVLYCDEYKSAYRIEKTNGSIYTWQSPSAKIIEGQGSNSVKVLWDSNSVNGMLWVDENVSTDLETCFGQSNPLLVINPKKMLGENIHLKTISGGEQDPRELHVQFEIANKDFFQSEIQLLNRDINTYEWSLLGSVPIEDSIYSFLNQPLDKKKMEYRLLGFNICGDSALSLIHKNIFLETDPNEVENNIRLTWNPYENWEGLVKYDLYRKLDADSSIEDSKLNPFFKSVTSPFVYEKITDAFKHIIRIKAFPDMAGYIPSLSNPVNLKFDNEIFIANVITPNGDGKNDTWLFRPDNLFADNKVVILNRLGEVVYSKTNYKGEWSGENLAAGIYFYEFWDTQRQKNYKGYIHLIK